MYQVSEAHKAILDEIVIQFCGYFLGCIFVLFSYSSIQSLSEFQLVRIVLALWDSVAIYL